MTQSFETRLLEYIAQGDALGALSTYCRNAEELLGTRLVTFMTLDPETGWMARLYTNMPDHYPTSAGKPFNPTHWSDIVVRDKKTFVANTLEEVAAVFDDHALIASLGCGSVLNLPILIDGRVWGTLNVLEAEGHMTPDVIARAQSLRTAGAAILLLLTYKSLKGTL